MYKYRYITQTITWFQWLGPLSSVLCSIAAIYLCLYFRRYYWLIFKDPIESRHRVSTPYTVSGIQVGSVGRGDTDSPPSFGGRWD